MRGPVRGNAFFTDFSIDQGEWSFTTTEPVSAVDHVTSDGDRMIVWKPSASGEHSQERGHKRGLSTKRATSTRQQYRDSKVKR